MIVYSTVMHFIHSNKKGKKEATCCCRCQVVHSLEGGSPSPRRSSLSVLRLHTCTAAIAQRCYSSSGALGIAHVLLKPRTSVKAEDSLYYFILLGNLKNATLKQLVLPGHSDLILEYNMYYR